ncbi:hypothetical protein Tco_1352056 [Tanacetum coccineum]
MANSPFKLPRPPDPYYEVSKQLLRDGGWRLVGDGNRLYQGIIGGGEGLGGGGGFSGGVFPWRCGLVVVVM